MIYDCFPIFNELDMLKIRLNVMNPVVDKFLIFEATETFSGLKKPLYYQENKEMFKEFEDKIIHVVIDYTPEGDTHDRDTYQKNQGTKGLEGCQDDDIIIFSDLDEIPNPEAVLEIAQNMQKDKIYHFAQRMFYCYLNMEEVSGNLLSNAGDFDHVEHKQWIGSKMLTYKLLKEIDAGFGDLRFSKWKEMGIRVNHGGWHFGYMGGSGQKDLAKRVQEKVISAAHQEYNSKRVLAQVTDRIKDGKDIFGRDARFVRTEIDDSYPEYIRTHQEELSFLILPKENLFTKGFRKIKMATVDRCWRFLGKCKGRLLSLFR